MALRSTSVSDSPNWVRSRFFDGDAVAHNPQLFGGGAPDCTPGEVIVRQGGLNLAGRTTLVETAAILQGRVRDFV